VNIKDIITVDPDIMSGQAVFSGTRVPVESLFDHLEAGISLDDFLDDFPTVSKEQAVTLLDIANKLLTSQKAEQIYAAIAG
jgi:uncharacterized protein (DUF433 family)